MIERTIASIEEIMNNRGNFNKKLVNEEYLTQVVKELSEKPVWYHGDLTKKPDNSVGLVICKECRHMYWVTERKDANMEISGHGKKYIGPYCTPCSRDITHFIQNS